MHTNNKNIALQKKFIIHSHISTEYGVFENIGVEHTPEEFLKDQSAIRQAIMKNDIIMLEISKKNGYFDIIAQYAKSQNKKVYCIDPDPVHIPLFQWIASIGSALGFILLPMSESYVEAILTGGTGIFLAKYSIIDPSLLYTFKTFIINKIIHETMNYEQIAKKDRSFTIDGRTIIMMDYIQKVLSQHPDKKYVSITGAWHAEGFEYYKNKTDERKQKLNFYMKKYNFLIQKMKEW